MPHQNSKSIQDLRILITGATGGIGSAVALKVAQHGATVGLMGRDTKRLSEVSKQVLAAGGRVSTYSGDLNDQDYVSNTVKSFCVDMDGFDVVMHSAGLGLRYRFETTEIRQELDVIDVNMRASIALMKSVVPVLLDRSWGHVINFSALGAYYWAPFQRPYVASKAGFLAYCTSLNYELRQQNVFVSNVIFSGVDTAFIDQPNYTAYRESGRLMKPKRVADEVVDRLLFAPQQNFVIGSRINYWISRLSMFSPFLFQKIIESRIQPPVR